VAGIDVSPERLRASADQIEQSVQQMDADLDALEGATADYASACGSDDLGTAIAACYEAISDMAFDSYEQNLDELIGYAEGLDAMADRYEQAEQENMDAFDRIGEQL
jgi:prefoldin subunit 5